MVVLDSRDWGGSHRGIGRPDPAVSHRSVPGLVRAMLVVILALMGIYLDTERVRVR